LPHPIAARPSAVVFLILVVLVLLAYLPALSQPLIEDDYPNIVIAQRYGAVSGWGPMLSDSVFRLRTTTWLLMYGVNALFGMHAAAYYGATILLHILNTWLVYLLGIWRPLSFALTAWAAGFFAVYEGHQEAIMWLSGSTEPLLVLFGLASFLCVVKFLDHRNVLWYVASLVSFCLALLSKESAVILLPLLALPLVFDGKLRRDWPLLVPYTALVAFAVASVLMARTYSFRFQDGSFSLHAPFWLIWPLNFGRLFWFWGVLSLAAILIWKPAGYRNILAIAGGWAALSLLPYSFLTYSRRIPSRQLHLASVGLAILVGFALLEVYQRYWGRRRVLVMALCALIVAQNVIYLWTKKRSQFLERAAPTEQLLSIMRATQAAIYVQCYPRPRIIPAAAVQLMLGAQASDRLLWTEDEARAHPGAVTFCYPQR
jgi:dolichyl-phosphate-mannose-protein mannosyltransferase